MNRQWRSWAEFLRRFSGWSLWSTLTYRHPVSIRSARKHPIRFARALAQRAEGHVVVAYAGDPQSEGRAHFHVLVRPIEPIELPAESVHAAWRDAVGHLAGHVLTERPGRGCVEYLCKHTEPEVIAGCTRPNSCRRRRGCVEQRRLAALFR